MVMMRSPLFLLGLIARIALVILVLPKATAIWYAPFMEVTTSAFTLNPWSFYLAHGGSSVAFPYGYAMWLVFLPLTLVCKALSLPVHYGYGATLIFTDIGLLFILRSMLFAFLGKDRWAFLLSMYWLSPILLFATYWLGFNDLVPVLFLCIALYFTQKNQLFWAGIFSVIAISAKLSMIIAIPFFLIYLIRNQSMRRFLPAFLLGFFLSAVCFLLPTLVLPSELHMLLGNPEVGKIYQFSLPLGQSLSIYIWPLFYVVMLYGTWRVRRLNFELFNTVLGLSFLWLVLLTPAALGWFIWILPLFVFYQSDNNKLSLILTSLFSLLYVFAAVLPDYIFQVHTASMLRTAMLAIGFILAVRIWRETVSRNDYFKLSRKPFVIGIAGDSGAGKDTLSNALKGLFGSHSVSALSGDDYHLWDRQKPMWQVMTHLNPRANDLDRFAEDVTALTQGKSVSLRHYDHKTGKMSHPFRLKSNDFILVSGLHALYLPLLREAYHISIYLDIDENLRRYYKLRRDVRERGHTPERVLSSIAKREPDSLKFVKPQEKYADLVMSLQPIHPNVLLDETLETLPKVKLFVRSRSGLDELSLVRVLVGICGLHVDMDVDNSDLHETSLTIEGEPSREDIAMAAKILFPRILAFLDTEPAWEEGILGLMQLIVLSHINDALNRRLL